MENYFTRKRINEASIARCQVVLGYMLEEGIITDRDIISVITKTGNEILVNSDEASSYNKVKNTMLQTIHSLPIVLCDQPYLSDEIKMMLPQMLRFRYFSELEELEQMYKLGFLLPDEYNMEKQNLLSLYYPFDLDKDLFGEYDNQRQKIK